MDKKAFPNEPETYRVARNELLEAEDRLRQQAEEVAALRRALPLGGMVKEDYRFDEFDSPGNVVQTALSSLFAPGKDSLFLYGFMFGPDMENPCPMCSSLLDGLNGNASHIASQINMAVVARSPVGRIQEFAAARGWRHLRFLSSANNTYHVDYLAEDKGGNQLPMANVFVKRSDGIHHFWGSELLFKKFPGHDSRHVDFLWPLWNMLDLTPEGRGAWYPSLTAND